MSSAQDRNWQSPSAERAGLLFPGDLPQTSHDDQRQQQQQQHPHQSLAQIRTRSRSPARLITRLPRPISLLLVASVDLLTTLLFTFILDLHSRNPYDPTIADNGRPDSTLRLLTLGYVRSSCALGMAMRRNWPSRGRLGVLLGFVGTGLEALWEINMSVLYRGWKGDTVDDRTAPGEHGVFTMVVEGDEGKKRLIFLILQLAFASMEYVAYALSIHYAAQTTHRGLNGSSPPMHTGGRPRATSVRFDERDRRVEQDVFGSMPGGRTDNQEFLRPPTLTDQVDQDVSESESDDEAQSELSTDEDASEDDLERSSGSSEDDEDEIIDLPLPEEAKIERKTSIMSLRSRHRSGSHPPGSGVGTLLDEEQRVGTGLHGEDEDVERRPGVWGSIRGALGWEKKSERTRRSDGYGTI